jgi:RNA polymerase sigma factor (sigma-70 family)
MTTITNHTTYDLAYYYADLRKAPRLTDQERQNIITTLPSTHDEAMQVKHKLIESYLHFAKRIVIDLCPSSLYQRSLPDLIGEANLTIVEFIMRKDLRDIYAITPYLAAWIEGRVKAAISNDRLIKVGYHARARAREQGTAEQLYAFEYVQSLDALMEWFETDDLEEPPVTSITPTTQAPERDPEQRAQVETYLSYLSPRAQAILRLRYGLYDENERRHTTAEIMKVLGLKRDAILTTERDAMKRLHALVTGEATLVTRKGKTCISYPTMHDYTPTPERELALREACTQLQAQGDAITGHALHRITKIPIMVVYAFLHNQPGYVHETNEAKAQKRQGQLEEAYSRLEAQRKSFGSVILAREAHVGKPAALKFLKARRGQNHVTV